jgi:hypothetical protein
MTAKKKTAATGTSRGKQKKPKQPAAPAQKETATTTAPAGSLPADQTPAQMASEPVAVEQAPPSEPVLAKPKGTRKAKKAPGDRKANKLSALDAAAKVLAETGQPMTCPELITAMAAKGYWSSPTGQTPSATLYAAMLRELQTKGSTARFVKVGPGKFALQGSG